MSKVILIFWWFGYSGVITNMEFDTRAACEAAGKAVQAKARTGDFVCVEKFI